MIWTCGVALCSTAKKQLVPLSDWKGMLRYSDHVVGEAIEMYRRDCAMGLEGIVCKRASAPYRQGRSNAWVKVKCRNREEFVVIGWTLPQGHRTGVGSLSVGYYSASGERHYVGGVGAGFNPHELSVLRAQLDRIPGTAPRRVWYAGDPLHRMIRWVRPELVVEVEYAGWSRSGRLGQPVFLGILEDKSPEEVVREIADPRAARIAVTSHSGGVSRNG
jgi:bifunctional non-homologous end joining protein LigD